MGPPGRPLLNHPTRRTPVQIIQRRCTVCQGKGLVQRGKYLRKCSVRVCMHALQADTPLAPSWQRTSPPPTTRLLPHACVRRRSAEACCPGLVGGIFGRRRLRLAMGGRFSSPAGRPLCFTKSRRRPLLVLHSMRSRSQARSKQSFRIRRHRLCRSGKLCWSLQMPWI